MDWSTKFAKRSRRIQPSVIREILKLTQKSQVISFAGGLPAPSLFPTQRIQEMMEKVLSEKGAEALQYSTTEGYLPLREWVAKRFSVPASQVQIVSGSQQGLDLIAKIFFDPGDHIIVANPTYMGALRAFDPYEVNYLAVDCDEEGFLPDALEAALKQGAKMIYALANFDNPTGITMSLARRKSLIALAERYNVPILEDDPYGELRFKGEFLPSLYALAPHQVIHASTFSKIMVPGFRLAWVIAAPSVISLLERSKQAADLHTATITQMVAYEVSKDGFMEEQISNVRDYYGKQRDMMLKAMERHFPKEIHWTKPEGGMFLWVTLPRGLDSLALLETAVKDYKVAYVPGSPFHANGGGENTLRLSYSVATAEQVETGIAKLGKVFTEALNLQPA